MAGSSARRARERNAKGKFTAKQITELHEQQYFKCNICKCCIQNKFHVDHIMPLKLGGNNDISNIQLLCQSCNLKKGAKHPNQFLKELGLLY